MWGLKNEPSAPPIQKPAEAYRAALRGAIVEDDPTSALGWKAVKGPKTPSLKMRVTECVMGIAGALVLVAVMFSPSLLKLDAQRPGVTIGSAPVLENDKVNTAAKATPTARARAAVAPPTPRGVAVTWPVTCLTEPSAPAFATYVPRCLIYINVLPSEGEDRTYLLADGALVGVYLRVGASAPPAVFQDVYRRAAAPGVVATGLESNATGSYTLVSLRTPTGWIGASSVSGSVAFDLLRPLMALVQYSGD